MSYAWTRYSTLPFSGRFNQNSLVFGNSQFVAIGVGGFDDVAVSSDGFTWVGSIMQSNGFWGVVDYGLDVLGSTPTYVASTLTGKCNKSLDGLTWTLCGGVTVSGGDPVRTIKYGNGVFVMLTRNGRTFHSNNLNSGWTEGDTLPPDPPNVSANWHCLAFGNGIFVAATRSGAIAQAATSVDGATWTTGITPPQQIEDFAFGNGRFMGVEGGSGAQVTTTTDGVTWTTPVALPSVDGTNYTSIAFGSSLWVTMTTNTGNSAVSADNGATWEQVDYPTPGPGENGANVRFGADVFVSQLDAPFFLTNSYNVLVVVPPDTTLFLSQGFGGLAAVSTPGLFGYYLEKWAEEVDARGGQMNRQADSFIEFNAPDE